MKVVTSSQMREIDKKAGEEFSIPSLQLMENAGLRVYETIRSKLGSPDNKVFYIFAGKGNNGGDGFVVAKHLSLIRTLTKVFLLGKIEEIRGDARVNLDLALKRGVKVIEVKNIEDIDLSPPPDLIIDALLGTGIKGEVTGLMREVIELINRQGKPVISIDLPSGLDADTGRVKGSCIKATWTVTMGLPKVGLLIYPGLEYVGDLIVADIGFPPSLIEKENIEINLTSSKEVKELLPQRYPDSHKGDYGRVLVLAGSVGFSGAAYLCSQGALRIGAGLVTLGVPESLNEVMEVKLTEVMTKPLPETKEKTLSLRGENVILDLVKRFDVLALGPGLSTNQETKELVRRLITKVSIPLVIDADGLNALAESVGVINKVKAPLILTPHPGELARLLKVTIEEVQSKRIEMAKRAAERLGVILVLKGARTIIACPSGEVFINPTGNAGMASGGTGDVLTGMIAGLLGQGLKPLQASLAGVYLHGLAADLRVKRVGELSLIATDLLDALPEAVREVRSH